MNKSSLNNKNLLCDLMTFPEAMRTSYGEIMPFFTISNQYQNYFFLGLLLDSDLYATIIISVLHGINNILSAIV